MFVSSAETKPQPIPQKQASGSLVFNKPDPEAGAEVEKTPHASPSGGAGSRRGGRAGASTRRPAQWTSLLLGGTNFCRQKSNMLMVYHS